MRFKTRTLASRQLTTGHCSAVPTRASQSDSRRTRRTGRPATAPSTMINDDNGVHLSRLYERVLQRSADPPTDPRLMALRRTCRSGREAPLAARRGSTRGHHDDRAMLSAQRSHRPADRKPYVNSIDFAEDVRSIMNEDYAWLPRRIIVAYGRDKRARGCRWYQLSSRRMCQLCL
jgi:hypothetical protein